MEGNDFGLGNKENKNMTKIILIIVSILLVLIIGYIIINTIISNKEKPEIEEKPDVNVEEYKDGIWMLEALPLKTREDGTKYGEFGNTKNDLKLVELQFQNTAIINLLGKTVNLKIDTVVNDDAVCDPDKKSYILFGSSKRLLSLEPNVGILDMYIFANSFLIVPTNSICATGAQGTAYVFNSDLVKVHEFKFYDDKTIYSLGDRLYYHDCDKTIVNNSQTAKFYSFVIKDNVLEEKLYKEEKMFCAN